MVDTTDDSRLRSWLVNFTGRETLPYFFVDHRPVGGLDEVMALERSDRLDRLVRGAVQGPDIYWHRGLSSTDRA